MSVASGFDYLLKGLPTEAVNRFVLLLFRHDQRNDCLVLRPEFVAQDGSPMQISEGVMRALVKQAVET